MQTILKNLIVTPILHECFPQVIEFLVGVTCNGEQGYIVVLCYQGGR
jgi:hypothetical protein